MKRETLVARNLRLSAARHQPSARQRLRRLLLNAASTIPVAPARTPDRQRILLLRPDHLGDALLTLPAIDALRASFPDAELAALASPAATAVLKSLARPWTAWRYRNFRVSIARSTASLRRPGAWRCGYPPDCAGNNLRRRWSCDRTTGGALWSSGWPASPTASATPQPKPVPF